MGGAAKMATQAIPPPPPRGGIVPKIGGFWRSHQFPPRDRGPSICQQDAKKRQQAAKWTPRDSRDQWGAGWENAISPHTLQLMVITRSPFHKLGVENPLLPYCNVKACLPLSYELWEANILTRQYRSCGEGYIRPQSSSLHSTDNISAEDSEEQEQSRPHRHTWNSKLFVVFPLKSTAAHSLHIQHHNIFNVDWG